MGTTLLEVSQIVTGLVLTNKLAAVAVQTDRLMPPFGDVVRMKRDGVENDEIIQRLGLGAVQPALAAAHSLNGTTDANWLEILETTYMQSIMGAEMEKIGKKLKDGKDVDPTRVRHLVNQFGKGRTGTVPLSEIKGVEIPRIMTGYKPIDRHIGGFPEAGLIVVGGKTGAGKTTFLRDLTKCFVKEHPDKRVLVYSLEMYDLEISGRFREAGAIEEQLERRILINCEHLSIHEVFSDAAKFDNVGLVLIDFADMLVEGEGSEGKYTEIYLASHYGAKDLHVPVVVFAQFTKEADKRGGVPRSYDIKWSSAAYQLAWMQLMLYRPDQDPNAETENLLPAIPDTGYLVFWKVRGGIVGHPRESIGAIQVSWDGVKGWSRGNDKWFSIKI